jgi:glutamate-1-semialdehyde 2,1-aminomutase
MKIALRLVHLSGANVRGDFQMDTQEAAASTGVDPIRVASMLETEREAFTAKRPNAGLLFERAKNSQLNGTPTYRIHHSPPSVPLALKRAVGGRLWDTDGHIYADFSLSGSAALFGHSHPKIVAALREQLDLGMISDWPGEDHVAVTEAMQEAELLREAL